MDDRAPHATHMFAAYFHQDCLLDDPNWESVIERYKGQEPRETVESARQELIDVLSTLDDRELEAFFYAPNWRSFYDPGPDGLTLREWVQRITDRLIV